MSDPWKKILFEPSHEPGGDMSIRFVLGDDRGACHFLMAEVEWQLKYPGDILTLGPKPFELGYHSPEPRYEGQESMGPCEHLGGRPCYYDGSSLNARPVLDEFLSMGVDAVWATLRQMHHELFGDVEAD